MRLSTIRKARNRYVVRAKDLNYWLKQLESRLNTLDMEIVGNVSDKDALRDLTKYSNEIRSVGDKVERALQDGDYKRAIRMIDNARENVSMFDDEIEDLEDEGEDILSELIGKVDIVLSNIEDFLE